jgi:hypothetical protein
LNCQLLAVTPNELTFSDFGESKTLTVSASNTSWEFVDYPEWITISPSSGSTSTTVTVTATQNTSADLTRTCVFYLKSTDPTWEYQAYVSATQKSAEEYIKLAPSALSFDAAVSTKTVEVESNVKWEVKCSETWVTLSKSETSFEVKVAENITESVRNASIMVYGGNVTEYVTITQQANGISCSVDRLEFGQNGGTLDFSINSATSWTTKSSNSWIHVSPEMGTAGQNTLSVTVDRNELSTERHGFVYLQVDSKTIAQVSIAQNGVYLNTDASSLSFSPRPESKSLSLSCNVDWSISSSAFWIRVSDKKGAGDCAVTVTVDENISDEERIGELIIQSSEGEIVKYIEIHQTGISISTEVASLYLPYTGKAQNLNIDVNASWAVVSQYDWLSFSPTSGTYNDKVIAVSAEENAEETERTASFSINASGYSKDVNIIQEGKYFNINSDALTVAASASKVSLSIKTTETWETEVSDSWLSTSPSSGDGNADILISVAANNMAEPRSGKVIFKPADGRQIVINVTQKGMTLNINPDTITFDYKGTSQLINVDTEGEFSVTSKSSWIIVDQVYANGFQVSAEMNENAKKRSGTVVIQIKNSSMVRTLYVTQDKVADEVNYVDLGLPSGTKWRKYNLGATREDQLGDTYCWAETSTRTTASWSTYKYGGSAGAYVTKYTTQWGWYVCCSIVDGLTTLSLEDDAAYANTDGYGVIPSLEQVQELLKYCTCTNQTNPNFDMNNTKTWIYGSEILVFEGRNGNTIEIPSFRYWKESTVSNSDYVYYWINEVDKYEPCKAKVVSFNSGKYSYLYRISLQYIRPVLK